MLKLLVLLALAAVCFALPDDTWGDNALDSETDLDSTDVTAGDVDRRRIQICIQCRWCWRGRYRACRRRCCRLGIGCRWRICIRSENNVEAAQEPEMLAEQDQPNDVESFTNDGQMEATDETGVDVERRKFQICIQCKWCWRGRYTACRRRCCRLGWRCRWRICRRSDEPAKTDQEPEAIDEQIESNEAQSLTTEATVDATEQDVGKKRWYVCRVCKRCIYGRYSRCGRKCCWFGKWCRWRICRRENTEADAEVQENDDQIEKNEVESLTSEADVDETEPEVGRRRWYICRVCKRCYWGHYYRCRRRCCLFGRWCRWRICRHTKDDNDVAESKVEENEALTAQSEEEHGGENTQFCCKCRRCSRRCRRCGKRCCCKGSGRCRCTSCSRSGPSFFVDSI